MSNEFVVGGKVECVSNNGVSDCISLFNVYEILEVIDDAIMIKDDYGMDAYYGKDRFKPFKTANEPSVTDKEGNVVSGISNTGEPYKVENGELKPMPSMTKEYVDNATNNIDANTQIIKLPQTINVLGTTYTIEVIPVEEDSYLENIHGYCDFLAKSIVLRQLKPTDYQGNIYTINAQYKTNLRHELMHAFLYESGLDSSTLDGWARNEEMIDYMALQLPKIFRVFNECGITE